MHYMNQEKCICMYISFGLYGHIIHIWEKKHFRKALLLRPPSRKHLHKSYEWWMIHKCICIGWMFLDVFAITRPGIPEAHDILDGVSNQPINQLTNGWVMLTNGRLRQHQRHRLVGYRSGAPQVQDAVHLRNHARFSFWVGWVSQKHQPQAGARQR